ncbi:hypothetical protein, partial [Undibacterium sp. CCC3.4]|uniref:hypothetical protein n=1 Tax=Undibacterium sp. CCC3.4 TaxID=3048609 RepID=UPI002B22FF4E
GAATFLTAAGAAGFFATGFFAAVAILRLLHKYLGKCAVSRIANSGALCRVMQVFFVAFCIKCVVISRVQCCRVKKTES